jgi:shikimate dehydrogenase
MRDTPRCFGVIGDPIDHSLSPVIHNAAFRRQKLNCIYLPLHVRARDIKRVLTAMALTDIEGCNVTTPHKQAIIPFLDRLDPSARLAGAVNTIYRRGGKWIGANTDGVGFVMACKWRGIRLTGKTITILGAGGVASAILAALLTTGVQRVIILNRSRARAQRLRTRLFKKSKVAVTVAPLTAAAYRRYFPETDLLIHATSMGLGKSRPLTIPLQHLPPHAAICDCQYRRGGPTPLIRQACSRQACSRRASRQAMGRRLQVRRLQVRRRKRLIIDGLDLLLAQAGESYRLWTGRRAPISTMRRYCGTHFR